MFVVGDSSKGAAEIEELPDEDASALELMKYNYNRLHRKYFHEPTQRRLVINSTCFVVAVFCMNQYGDLFSV